MSVWNMLESWFNCVEVNSAAGVVWVPMDTSHPWSAVLLWIYSCHPPQNKVETCERQLWSVQDRNVWCSKAWKIKANTKVDLWPGAVFNVLAKAPLFQWREPQQAKEGRYLFQCYHIQDCAEPLCYTTKNVISRHTVVVRFISRNSRALLEWMEFLWGLLKYIKG